MTPDQVHYGQADDVATQLARKSSTAHSNPERFVKKPPEPPLKPTAAGRNPPTQRPENPSLTKAAPLKVALVLRDGLPGLLSMRA